MQMCLHCICMRICPSWYFLGLLSQETWIIWGCSPGRWVTHGPISTLSLMKVSQLQKKKEMESIGLRLAFSRWSSSLPYRLPLAWGRDNIGQMETVHVTSKFAEESERWSGRSCILSWVKASSNKEVSETTNCRPITCVGRQIGGIWRRDSLS